MVRILPHFVLFFAFTVALPAKAQLNDPNSLGNLLRDLPRTPVPEKGSEPAKIIAAKPTRGGARVLALSLRGLLNQPWKVPAISSVHGFVIDDARNDVILIARSGGREALDWRDFAEALRAVRGGGEAPYCSLDPDPTNLTGEQRLRVGGVRYDSHFGRVMADADYLMKKVTVGLVAAPGLSSFGDRLSAYFAEDCSRLAAQGSAPLLNRFWFTAADPGPNDALSSSSGKTVWVRARLNLLTDESFATQAGLVSRGRVNPIAAGYARDFSSRLTDMSVRPEFALFRQLHGLFQWVYVSNLAMSKAGGNPETALLLSNWSDRLGVLESSRRRYSGVVRDVDLSRCGSGYAAALQGGVEISPRLPSYLSTSSDLGVLEAAVTAAVDAAPNDVFWELSSGLSETFFAE